MTDVPHHLHWKHIRKGPLSGFKKEQLLQQATPSSWLIWASDYFRKALIWTYPITYTEHGTLADCHLISNPRYVLVSISVETSTLITLPVRL